MKKLINGVEVELTGAEVAAINAERAAVGAFIPEVVTMRQARLALLQSGLLPTVDAAVAAMTGAAGDAARIEWEFSGEVYRDQPIVVALSSVLGLTSDDLDNLFLLASGL